MSDSTRESLFCQEKKVAVSIDIETAKLDEAIVKAKELAALLREANEDTDRIDYEIQADDCTELTDADKEILERLDYFISNDDNLKEISIIPCNEKKIVLNSMMEVERFIAIIQDRSRLVFDT